MSYYVLIYRLDLALFALLSVASALYADFIVLRHLAAGRPRYLIWTYTLVLLGLGLYGAHWIGELQRARLRVGIEGVAPTYAVAMQLMGHSQVTSATPPTDPLYLNMIEQQKKWLKNYPAITDINPLRPGAPGVLAFIIDSETDYDGDGRYDESREARTALGEVYPEPLESMFAALRGESVFDDIPTTDRWGTTVSAFTPMFDEHEQVEAIVGIDFFAADWIRTQLLGRGCVLGACMTVLIGLVVLISVAHMQRAEIQTERQFGEEMHRQKMALENSLRTLKSYEAQLERLAWLDRLTGLPNRSLLMERMRRSFERSQTGADSRFALLFIDFDGFKQINDTLGHDAGDQLLMQIAQRLKSVVATSESISLDFEGTTTARLGGDEFVVILPCVSNMEEVEGVAERLIAVFDQPYELNSQQVRATASIGIAINGPQHTSMEDVLHDADAAMYAAKAHGKACYAIAAETGACVALTH